MTRDGICDLMKKIANEMDGHDHFGALHIFIEDGNCDDEDLEFCMNDERLTAPEAEFLTRMMELPEEVRYGAYALTNYGGE